MKRKVFTLLMAFLATVGNAVWAEGSGTQTDPWVINLDNPQSISDNGGFLGSSREIVSIEDGNVIQIHIGGDDAEEDNGYYRITGTTSQYRIEIGGDGLLDPKPAFVHLELNNASISTTDYSAIRIYDPGKNGDEPTVNIQLTGENRLTTTSDSWAAISVNANANLNIIAESTGSLYATGAVGIGNADEPDDRWVVGDEQKGAVGNIGIYGGTIVAMGNGEYPGIGGRKYDETDVTIDGNTFVVTNNGNSNTIQNYTKGIFYDTSERDNTASVYGAVTLNSEYPSMDGILERELKFDITDAATLTLGAGISFPTTRLANDDDKNKLYAYELSYDLNKTVGHNTITIADETPYVSIYCAPNTTLAELPTASNATPTWQCLGWAQQNGESYTNLTGVPSTTLSTTADNTANQIKATSIWAVKQWTNVNVTYGETLDADIQLIYPEAAKSLFTITNGTDLNQYGAALNDNMHIVAHTTGATASEGNASVTLQLQDRSETITIPFTINNNAPDLGDTDVTTLTVENKVYTGSAINPIKSLVVNGENVAFDAVDIKYKSDNDGTAGDDLEAAPINVGTYWVYVKAKENSTSYKGESDPQQFQITVATAKVTANEKAIENPTSATLLSFVTEDLTVTPLGEDNLSITSADVALANTSDPWQTLAGTYKIKYTNITLDGTSKSNYTAPTEVEGTLKVTIKGTEDNPLDPGDGDDENPVITPDEPEDGENGWTWDSEKDAYTRVYDGVAFPFTPVLHLWDAENGAEEEQTLTTEQYTITYTPENGTASEVVPDNVGTYTATIKITDETLSVNGSVEPIKLIITPRPMDVTINTLTAEDLDKTSVTEVGATYEAFNAENNRGLVEAEKDYVGISGTMSIQPKEDATQEGKKAYTVTFSNLALANSGGDDPIFLASNYTPTFKYGNQTLTDGAGSVDITIDEITPGEETEITDGDEDDNDWAWDGKQYVVVYDGNPHGIAEVNGETPSSVTYNTADGKAPVNAGHYTATVVVEGKTGTFQLWIKQRPLNVNFNLSSITEEQVGKTLDANGYVSFTNNVTGETPLLDDEATITIAAQPNANGKYAVTFDNILLVENEGFNPDNYTPSYYLNGELIAIDENGDGESGGEGDDEGGITINPDDEGDKDDDDDHNPGHGGSDINRPAKYYNIYVDTAATSDGVELSLSKDVVKEGNQVSVYIDKILDGYNAENMKVQIKRSLYGYWEELEEGVQPGEYIIYNIYHDIYVKVTDVEKDDATGIEDVEGVKAYAKDGSIYVYTPNREEVTIISMSGTIIKHAEQIGLQIGEKVFKLKN